MSFNATKSSLRFPQEIGTDEVPNFITFRPVEINFGKYNTAKKDDAYGNAFDMKAKSAQSMLGGVEGSLGNVLGSVNSMGDQLKSGVGGIIDSLANGVSSILGSLGGGLMNIKGDVNLFGGSITARVDIGSLGLPEGAKQANNTVVKKPGINLYMPMELQHALNAKYNETELGAVGMTAVEMVNTNAFYHSEGSVGGAAGESIKRLFTSIVNDKIKRNEQFGSAVQRATGRVSNAYTYAIFDHMGHRNFNYSFKLIARSYEDSKIIKDICDSFMYYMLPSKSGDDFHHYTVPHMWEIAYYHGASKNEYLDQPNNCFLKDVKIKYNSAGKGMTYDQGQPIDVDLELSFMEIEPLYNNAQREVMGPTKDEIKVAKEYDRTGGVY